MMRRFLREHRNRLAVDAAAAAFLLAVCEEQSKAIRYRTEAETLDYWLDELATTR